MRALCGCKDGGSHGTLNMEDGVAFLFPRLKDPKAFHLASRRSRKTAAPLEGQPGFISARF